MRKMAVFDAKTHFSSLIHDVYDNKEIIIITRRGEEVAKIIPIVIMNARPVREVIGDILALGKNIDERSKTKNTVADIRQMRDEGRK